MLLDVTERKALEQELKRRATHDGLTGLPNRALFMERVGQSLSRSRRRESEVAVLFVDLNDFKHVNDSSGHDAGDRLLAGVAERLKSVVRPEDTVARFGGDEFVVLLEDADRERAIRVAERIARALETPFDLPDDRTPVTASTGIALSEPCAEGPNELVKEADQAMYRTKEDGKGRYSLRTDGTWSSRTPTTSGSTGWNRRRARSAWTEGRTTRTASSLWGTPSTRSTIRTSSSWRSGSPETT